MAFIDAKSQLKTPFLAIACQCTSIIYIIILHGCLIRNTIILNKEILM